MERYDKQMADAVLYLIAKQNVEAQKEQVLLGDAASIYCEDREIRDAANKLQIYEYL